MSLDVIRIADLNTEELLLLGSISVVTALIVVSLLWGYKNNIHDLPKDIMETKVSLFEMRTGLQKIENEMANIHKKLRHNGDETSHSLNEIEDMVIDMLNRMESEDIPVFMTETGGKVHQTICSAIGDKTPNEYTTNVPMLKWLMPKIGCNVCKNIYD